MLGFEKRLSFIVLLVVGVVMAGVASAAAGGSAEQAVMSLEQAVKIALETNPEITLAEFGVQEADLNLKQAEANKGLNVSEEALADARKGLEDAQKNLLLVKMDVALAVEKAYYDVLKSLNNLSLAEKSVAIAEKQLAIGQTKHEAGLITEMDVMGLEMALDQARAGYEQAAVASETAKMNLNSKLGRSLDADIADMQVAKQVDYTVREYDLAECINVALENRNDVESAEEAVRDARRNMELLLPEFTAKADLERAQMQVKRAEINLDKVKQGAVFAVRGAYYTFAGAVQNIDFKQRALVQAEKVLQVAEKRYEAGLISLGDIENKRKAVLQAQIAVESAIYDCKVAEAGLLKAMGESYGPLARTNEK